MPFVYVYSPSDFETGFKPPAEDASYGAAAGSSPFNLRLKPGATGTRVEVTDNDGNFDEVDSTQTLTNAINLDGTNYASGTTIHIAYDLINTGTGHKVSSVNFGGDPNSAEVSQGIVSTVPLVPGTTYSFNSERTSNLKSNPYTGYVSCFMGGTLIDTGRGLVPVETLMPGDMIRTWGGGQQPLRMLLHRHLPERALQANSKLRPIRLLAGALGASLPERDLWVSPQHRFVCSSPIAERMFDTSEVLVSAANLTTLPSISVDDTIRNVDYFHLVMDQHEVIFAEGAMTESFYFGPTALASLDSEVLAELITLFPDHVLGSARQAPEPALPIPVGKKQKRLVERHRKNNKSLVSI